MLSSVESENVETSMSASPHDKKKFGDYVRIHAIEGELITREDETKVLKEGITQFGLELNEARGILLGVAADHDIALVSSAEQQVATLLEHVAKKNRINHKGFADAVAIYKRLTKSRIPDIEIRKRIKQMVLDRGWKARKTHWLIGSRRWFRRI
ncbi:MAG: hypothetical protein HYR63_01810 [Proteobacteria bacterium]|nr:hypothetical protein [Pseudomonadota bacterium]